MIVLLLKTIITILALFWGACELFNPLNISSNPRVDGLLAAIIIMISVSAICIIWLF